jgi:ornithine cyclodeaminase/alanine dehydrogenase-like protein (mu-crystallin family)
MIVLKAADVRKALPMEQAILSARQAYSALSSGKVELPLRCQLLVAPHQGTSLFMPAFVRDEVEGEVLSLKVVSVFPNNAQRGIPIIHAALLVLKADTGQPLALLEGSALTAVRTGAASGIATDLFARPDAESVTVFGAGVQGRTQLEAVCTVRRINTAWIVDPNLKKARTFVDELSGQGRIPRDFRVATDPGEAASFADIICTATTSKTPVYPAEAIRPGTHINGVGSFALDMIENPPEIFSRAATFIDSRQAILAEAGEIVAAINRKILFPAELTEIGEVILGKEPGRVSNDQITFFKSVGIAAQDATAARLALENALEMGLGQRVAW